MQAEGAPRRAFFGSGLVRLVRPDGPRPPQWVNAIAGISEYLISSSARRLSANRNGRLLLYKLVGSRYLIDISAAVI